MLYEVITSGVANVLACVKTAKHFEMGEEDVLLTVGTDSMEMYGSRLEEMRAELGEFTPVDAAVCFERHMLGQGLDNMLELGHWDRKRVHSLNRITSYNVCYTKLLRPSGPDSGGSGAPYRRVVAG